MSVSRNVVMFGFEDIELYVDSVKESMTYQIGGMNPIVMSVLSDAQEQLSRGDVESARQQINVAKYLLTQDK